MNVLGVADPVTVTPQPQEYAEAAVDGGAPVRLTDLFTATPMDDDGSERLTLRVTGLPEGFSLSHGTLMSHASATGEDRVWVLNTAQLALATIAVPRNFNGQVDFRIIPVTTENDGNSRTGASTTVGFTVTPSPEAQVTTSVGLTEDEFQPLGIQILHRNGDTDERLVAIRIPVDAEDGNEFTLWYDGQPLAEALTPTDGYYEIAAADLAKLAARTTPHKDGHLGEFEFKYQILDPSLDDPGAGDVTEWFTDTFTLTAQAVTDPPTMDLGPIVVDAAIGSVDAPAATVTLTQPGDVTVNVNIGSPDTDGSEKLIRIIVDGVPLGVTVAPDTVGTSGTKISLTAQVRDNGEQAEPGTDVLSVSVDWDLVIAFTGGEGEKPATIQQWAQNDFAATEDASFTLNQLIDAAIVPQSSQPNVLTITLKDVAPGMVIEGMTLTRIDGEPVWTASVSTPAGARAGGAGGADGKDHHHHAGKLQRELRRGTRLHRHPDHRGDRRRQVGSGGCRGHRPACHPGDGQGRCRHRPDRHRRRRRVAGSRWLGALPHHGHQPGGRGAWPDRRQYALCPDRRRRRAP